MSKIVVIGCGVVGALVAYELSQVPGLSVTVVDQQQPAQAATGAALGVLMGVISHKIKGNAWQRRQISLQRYETLIPELEALVGRKIPFNRQGILSCLEGEDLAGWEKLVQIRRSQGWRLEIWDAKRVQSSCPQLNCEIKAAVYSPQDRQVDPARLTLALVDAAQHNGVTCKFGVTIEGVESTLPDKATHRVLCQIQTTAGSMTADWLVIAAGLGTNQLMAILKPCKGSVPIPNNTSLPPVDIRPVLGQALHLRLGHPMGHEDFQPVITGNDVHIVPVGEGDYWVGATVEFPTVSGGEVVPDSAGLEAVRQQAITFCPALAEAGVVRTWSGLRPRPEKRSAPIIGQLPGYSNVLLATGHYRNGVLLAPATAQAIRQMILDFRL